MHAKQTSAPRVSARARHQLAARPSLQFKYAVQRPVSASPLTAHGGTHTAIKPTNRPWKRSNRLQPAALPRRFGPAFGLSPILMAFAAAAPPWQKTRRGVGTAYSNVPNLRLARHFVAMVRHSQCRLLPPPVISESETRRRARRPRRPWVSRPPAQGSVVVVVVVGGAAIATHDAGQAAHAARAAHARE